MEDARVRLRCQAIYSASAELRLCLIDLSTTRSTGLRTQGQSKPLFYRYTGYIRGMGETFAKTPVMAQWETKEPPPDSFLYARSKVYAVSDARYETYSDS